MAGGFESVDIKFDAAELFDRYMKENRQAHLPECGDLEIVVKPGGMESGRSAVMITFTVMVKGKRKRVQAVTTLRLLGMIADVCQMRIDFESLAGNEES